jgi:hypothetical protein
LQPGSLVLALALFALVFLAPAASVDAAPPAAKGDKKPASPYPLYPANHTQVREALLKGDAAETEAAVKALDEIIDRVLTPPPLTKPAGGAGSAAAKADPSAVTEANRIKHLEQLLTLRNAADRFSKARDREMAAFLVDRPRICSRLLHAMDEKDDLDGAFKVLSDLKQVDPRRFEAWSEFCIAYAVVWDDFKGHWWVEKNIPLEEGTMLDTYKDFIANERRLLINPSQLPFELAVYVVGTRLSRAEREWVRAKYAKFTDLHPASLYKSVPWTKKLALGHGIGDPKDYTLDKIQKVGGVCMEQAYFSENVLRLHGLPAVYTRGQGIQNGHAWIGALMMKPGVQWDFTFGRYERNHYYKGEVVDPTDPRRQLPDSFVKMTAALLKAGSMAKLEEGYFWLDAARWASEKGGNSGDVAEATARLDAAAPADPEPGEAARAPKAKAGKGQPAALTPEQQKAALVTGLLEKSLRACTYNTATWLYLAELAAKGAMDDQAARFWAGKVFDLTVAEYPDFTLDCLQKFLERVKDPKEKAAIYSRLYGVLAKNRPDLAAELKVAEGDLWLEQKNLDMAVESYLFPMVNFAKDKHVLDEAQSRLEGLNDKADEAELERAYTKVLKLIAASPKQNDPAIVLARKSVAKNLHDIYEKRGEGAKAAKLRSLM